MYLRIISGNLAHQPFPELYFIVGQFIPIIMSVLSFLCKVLSQRSSFAQCFSGSPAILPSLDILLHYSSNLDFAFTTSLSCRAAVVFKKNMYVVNFTHLKGIISDCSNVVRNSLNSVHVPLCFSVVTWYSTYSVYISLSRWISSF